MINYEITHDTVIKKAPPPRFLSFEKEGGNAPVISLLSGAPGGF